uniref:Uncharacterized protein n=1 Tax=Nelumbo nucifera TaxID=4432 RepID=A0A822ZQQ9_NELNU|nr:TPA_asm: hypothetical protein HUJ06_002378 [Nelumbo nucifera]
MKVSLMFQSPVVFAIICSCIYLLFLVSKSNGQATTDPIEVKALNSIFQQWGISDVSSWNISGEPCSGVAILNSTNIDDTDFNPGIKCNCSYNNGSTCHITHLKVYEKDVNSVIPEELANLTYLTYLYVSSLSYYLLRCF